MKIYKIPEDLRAFIFDIDSTLYTNQAYAFEQVDCQVRQFAKERGITADEARRMVADYRKKFAAEHEGSKVSLGNTLLAFGVPIEQSVQWRRELLEPADFLGRDEELIKTLKILQEKYLLICVTNNPVLPARKTLEAIGVSDFFPDIVGLDTCFKSKPALEPFETAVKVLSKSAGDKGQGQINAENCLAVGDRYDMDIKLPLEMGMGGILVSGVEEVYQILKSVL